MAQIGLSWCHKHNSSTTTTAAAATGATSGGRQCRSGCCSGGIGRLVRKLKKQSKILCSAASAVRPTASSAFQCKYDPLSYSLNFNCDSFDEDSCHPLHSFSSRFAAAGKPALVQSGARYSS